MRNLLLYLGIPILIIIITAAVLSTNKSTLPKTSELEQYFVQDMVDSFNIDYGSGQIEITLKEGMSPIKSTDSDSQSATTATQPATEQQETRSNSKKSKIVVKGQLADIQRFLDDIKPYYNPDNLKTTLRCFGFALIILLSSLTAVAQSKLASKVTLDESKATVETDRKGTRAE